MVDMKKILKNVLNFLNLLLSAFNLQLIRKVDALDFKLYNYKNYDEYKDVQIKYNKEKLDNIWADENILQIIGDYLKLKYSDKKDILGICHGTRNGFEQRYLNQLSDKFQVIGTDISDTAKKFENSFVWDFHDINESWVNQFDFVYTNSFDQSWKPSLALETWLNQINDDGCVILEQTIAHSPTNAGLMDPFGVKPTYAPYVFITWFGDQISIKYEKAIKSNNKQEAWIYFIKKNRSEIKVLKDFE